MGLIENRHYSGLTCPFGFQPTGRSHYLRGPCCFSRRRFLLPYDSPLLPRPTGEFRAQLTPEERIIIANVVLRRPRITHPRTLYGSRRAFPAFLPGARRRMPSEGLMRFLRGRKFG